MRVDYRKRYDQLKALVREKGTFVLREMYAKNKLHVMMGSRYDGAENVLHHYTTYLWFQKHPNNSRDSELAKDYACFLLDAFCAHREKHRWQISKSEGYRIAERASKAWEAKRHARGAIQEASP